MASTTITTADPLGRCIEAFAGVQAGKEWRGTCPLCHHNSLLFGKGNTVPVVGNCKKGCPQDQIEAALRRAIDMPLTGKPRIVAKPRALRTTKDWGWPDAWQPITQPTYDVLAASRSKSYTPQLETLFKFGFRERMVRGRAAFAYPITLDSVLQSVKWAYTDLLPGEKRRAWPQFAPPGCAVPNDLLFGIDENLPQDVTNIDGNLLVGHWHTAIFIVEGQWDALCLHELGHTALAISCAKQPTIRRELIARISAATDRIYLVPDNDADGARAKQLAELFPSDKISVVSFPAGVKDMCELAAKYNSGSLLSPSSNLRGLRAALEEVLAKPHTPEVTIAPELELIDPATIEPEAVNWFWDDRLPLNALAIFAGKPGDYKSTVAVDLIARVTRGDAFPDSTKPNPFGPSCVLMACAESSREKEVIPRLHAAGADLRNIRLVSGKVLGLADNPKANRLQIGPHLAAIENTIRKLNAREGYPPVRVLFFDPITSYYGDADMNKTQVIKPVLEAFAALADRLNLAVIALEHYNKNTREQDILYRISGASPATFRTVVCFGRDQQNPDTVILEWAKGNWAKRKPDNLMLTAEGVPIRVKNTLTGQWVEESQPRITWLGVTSKSVAEAIGQESNAPPCAKWLEDYFLDHKWHKATDLYTDALAAGFADRTVRAAKAAKNLPMVSRSFVVAGKKATWWAWGTPPTEAPGSEAGTLDTGGDVEEPL